MANKDQGPVSKSIIKTEVVLEQLTSGVAIIDDVLNRAELLLDSQELFFGSALDSGS